MNNEDFDIKIYGMPSDEREAPSELEELALKLEKHRKNGNFQKAEQLGKKLAVMTPERAGEVIPAADVLPELLPSSAMYQVRVLFVFTAHIALNRIIEPEELADVALNTMFKELRTESPGFYNNISDGTAFTFYNLSLKRNHNVELAIGENFAMLCGSEADETYSRIGTEIFNLTYKYIENQIKNAEFIF